MWSRSIVTGGSSGITVFTVHGSAFATVGQQNAAITISTYKRERILLILPWNAAQALSNGEIHLRAIDEWPAI